MTTGPLAADGWTAQHWDMTTTLITGANMGLGKETARQLIAAGHTAWISARGNIPVRTRPGGL